MNLGFLAKIWTILLGMRRLKPKSGQIGPKRDKALMMGQVVDGRMDVLTQGRADCPNVLQDFVLFEAPFK